MKKIFLTGVCVVLGGCQSMGNWADDVGQYLPVLSDERCEHWQCFTEGGKQQSEYNKQMLQQRWELEKKEDAAEENGETVPQQVPQNGAAPPPPPAPQPSYTDPEMDPWNNYKP